MDKFGEQCHTLVITSDLREFYSKKPKNWFVVRDEDDICLLHALLIGGKGTPYENGFFYFKLRIPVDYPFEPPQVELLTTHYMTVRFHWNILLDGTVMVETLGSGWSSTQTILTLLQSIQSLMFGHQDENVNVDYGHVMITYRTLGVAVIAMLQDDSLDATEMPAALKDIMFGHFKQNLEFYESVIQFKELDGRCVRDPFDNKFKILNYEPMSEDIAKLKAKFSQYECTSAYSGISEKFLLSFCTVKYFCDYFNDSSSSSDESESDN